MTNQNVKLKRRLVIIIFFVGLFFEIVGFLIGYADNVPFVFKFISPDYAKAEKGLLTLEKKMELNKQDIGFKEIAHVFFEELKLQNPPEALVDLSITRIIRGNPYLSFGRKEVKPKISIGIELSDDQKLNWELEPLTILVNELKNKNLFKWAVAIFFSGIVVQVIGFVIDKAASK